LSALDPTLKEPLRDLLTINVTNVRNGAQNVLEPATTRLSAFFKGTTVYATRQYRDESINESVEVVLHQNTEQPLYVKWTQRDIHDAKNPDASTVAQSPSWAVYDNDKCLSFPSGFDSDSRFYLLAHCGVQDEYKCLCVVLWSLRKSLVQTIHDDGTIDTMHTSLRTRCIHDVIDVY